MKVNKTILITGLILCCITVQNCSQSKKNVKENIAQSVNGPNIFPELLHTNIPGAPQLGTPQLIMGDSLPVRGEGNGWAAPAVYDWNGDGKKDLLIGEFGSGIEKGIGAVGHFIRVCTNKGSDAVPQFNDDFFYAYEAGAGGFEESRGTPLSIYTFCCFPFTPRFTDLNNDGHTDLLSGQYTPGYITWFRGSEDGFLPGITLEESYDPYKDRVDNFEEAMSLPATDPKGNRYWSRTDVDFGDFDNDGDQDMIIGGGQLLRICENIGTKSAPKFGKREFLLNTDGQNLKAGDKEDDGATAPYVVDWDQDGTLDILTTGVYYQKGNVAVTFFKGVPTEGHKMLQFEPGIPLFTAKNGDKAFPGSYLNICVTDWNNDGVKDLLIGTQIVTLNGGVFDHESSWDWRSDLSLPKSSPAHYSANMKKTIAQQIKGAETRARKSGLSGEALEKKLHRQKSHLIKNYYGKEAYKSLAYQGYVYVMLGTKP